MLQYFLREYGTQLLMAVLCAVFGVLGHGIKTLAKSWLDTETKRSVAAIAVQFVEQAWKELHGPEKLQRALETSRELLAKKGLAFDPEEMQVLIEAALAEFNDAFYKPLINEATADAVRRVDTAE